MTNEIKIPKTKKIISWLFNRNDQEWDFDKFSFIDRHDPLEDLNLCYSC